MDMKLFMRGALPAVAFLAVAIASQAQAASVSYFLDQSNVSALPDGVNYLQVTIDDEGAAGDINFLINTLAPLSSLADNKFGLDQFGFNTSITLATNNIINAPANWSLLGSGNMDGFGGFSFRADTNGANNRIDPLSFSITGISGDVITDYVGLSSGTAGEGNVFFAAHVAGFKDSGNNTSAYFGGSTPVPVPAAAWLFGSGLLGLVGMARRKRS